MKTRDVVRTLIVVAWLGPNAGLVGADQNLAFDKAATASSSWSSAYSAAQAVDGTTGTRWSAAPLQTNGQWLAIDLGAGTAFDRVVLKEPASYARVTSHRLQSSNDGSAYTDIPGTAGTTIGVTRTIQFAPVSARYVRVFIAAASDVPTLAELEAYGPPVNLARNKPATASTTWSSGYTATQAVDGSTGTRWSAAAGQTTSQWLAVDLGAATSVGRVVLQEPSLYRRVTSFRMQRSSDGVAYTDIPGAADTTIGLEESIGFPAVSTRYLRLFVTTASDVPTLTEIKVYAPSTEDRVSWFTKARFGMFIHWGLYAVPAGVWNGVDVRPPGEWIMNRAKIPSAEYAGLASQFNPTSFDPDAWVELAQAAGMKYIVITSKHHEGFAMFKSAVTPFDVDATPSRRDLLKELAAACARHGMRLGFYYSHSMDWHEPNAMGNTWESFPPEAERDYDGYLRGKAEPQVREILTGYGPVALVWFDIPRSMTAARGQRFVDLLRGLQPDCLINGRLGGVSGDYMTTGDNQIPAAVVPGPWEVPATMNGTWGYMARDQNWKATSDLLFKLVDIASKGGNYLLNVGPTADGVIPAPSADRLRQMGAWLRVNGEAVYDTGPTPFGAELSAKAWRCTSRPGVLYFHLFTWTNQFQVSGVTSTVRKVSLLADPGRALTFQQAGGVVTIDLPGSAPDAIASVVRVELQ